MNIVRRALFQFLGLKSIDSDLHENDLISCTEDLKNLHDDMQAWFSDIFKENI